VLQRRLDGLAIPIRRPAIACRARGWLDNDNGITPAGRAALEAASVGLTDKEADTLVQLLGGPLYWGKGGTWTKAPSRDPEGVWSVWTKTVWNLAGRGLCRVELTGGGMVLLGDGLTTAYFATIAPVPLPSRKAYHEGSGPKVYGWHGTPPPGWRPGLAAPDVAAPHQQGGTGE